MEASEEGVKVMKTVIKHHKAAGMVVFSMVGGELKFLLLKSSLGWEFPKGHIEEGESELETAKRETEEETGLKIKNVYPVFKHISKYLIRKNYSTGEWLDTPEPKTVTYFLARSQMTKVNLSFEHDSYSWLSYEDARSKLKYGSKRETLELSFNILNNEN